MKVSRLLNNSAGILEYDYILNNRSFVQYIVVELMGFFQRRVFVTESVYL